MTPLSKPSAASKDRVNAQRKGLYGKIKIACKQLSIVDEDYRALLATRYAGKTSSTKLSLAELEDLIGYFKAQGWTPTKSRAPARAGSRKLADGVEAAKARLRGAGSIAEVASACGFACQSHLTRVFKAETSVTPALYRRSLMGRDG